MATCKFGTTLNPHGPTFEAMQVWYSALVRHSELAISQAAGKGIGTIIRGATRRVDPYESLADASAKLRLDELRDPDETAAQFLLRFVISNHRCPYDNRGYEKP